MRAMAGVVELGRPSATSLAVMGLASGLVVLGAWHWTQGALAAVSVCLLNVSAFAYNDLTDVAGDRVGAPHRPLPSGRVSEGVAWFVAWACLAGGVLVNLALPVGCLWYAAGFSALGVAYSSGVRLRARLGWKNGAAALVYPSVFVYAMLVAGSSAGVLWMCFGMGVVSVFAREILNDVFDEAGDREAGARTLCTEYGPRRATAIAGVALACYVVLAWVAAWCWRGEYPAFAAVTGGSGVVVAWIMARRLEAASKSRTGNQQVRRALKVLMAADMCALVVGRIWR